MLKDIVEAPLKRFPVLLWFFYKVGIDVTNIANEETKDVPLSRGGVTKPLDIVQNLRDIIPETLKKFSRTKKLVYVSSHRGRTEWHIVRKSV